MRIAFHYIDGALWTGGAIYLKNLFFACRSLAGDRRPEIVALAPHGTNREQFLSRIEYVDDVLLEPKPPEAVWSSFWKRQMAHVRKEWNLWRGVEDQESSLCEYLREHRIDAVFATRDFGPRFDLPLVAWIADFQHARMPEMFSEAEIQIRTNAFSGMARHADRVALSSNAALRDFELFAPHAAHKARVLSFVAQTPHEVYNTEPGAICDCYQLPRRFIYLPNQFWRHKNHDVVIRALSIVARKHPYLAVVCTGNTTDYRHPLFFGELMALVSKMGLRNNFIVLGIVPRDHVFQLLRQSLALLQPSLFEGWNTCVEEAKSLGKRVILSDLPVHREQAPPKAVYFNPRDPDALATCLAETFETAVPGPDHELETRAREQLPGRTRKFAEGFLEIVREAMGNG